MRFVEKWHQLSTFGTFTQGWTDFEPKCGTLTPIMGNGSVSPGHAAPEGASRHSTRYTLALCSDHGKAFRKGEKQCKQSPEQSQNHALELSRARRAQTRKVRRPGSSSHGSGCSVSMAPSACCPILPTPSWEFQSKQLPTFLLRMGIRVEHAICDEASTVAWFTHGVYETEIRVV